MAVHQHTICDDTSVLPIAVSNERIPPVRQQQSCDGEANPRRSHTWRCGQKGSLGIPDAGDKSRLGPSNRLQFIEKHRVFAVRGRAGMLGLPFTRFSETTANGRGTASRTQTAAMLLL